MKLTEARELVGPMGFSLGVRHGEYRLAPLDGSRDEREARAHYTRSLADAVDMAKHEADRERRRQSFHAAAEMVLQHCFRVTGAMA